MSCFTSLWAVVFLCAVLEVRGDLKRVQLWGNKKVLLVCLAGPTFESKKKPLKIEAERPQLTQPSPGDDI